jgi:hypothetical protein
LKSPVKVARDRKDIVARDRKDIAVRDPRPMAVRDPRPMAVRDPRPMAVRDLRAMAAVRSLRAMVPIIPSMLMWKATLEIILVIGKEAGSDLKWRRHLLIKQNSLFIVLLRI